MEMLTWILVACALAYLIKLSGYLIPTGLLDRPIVTSLAAAATVGLLAALVMVTTVGEGQSLAVDARILALGAAAIALLLRAPFIVVVLVGTAAAAGGRLLGVA